MRKKLDLNRPIHKITDWGNIYLTGNRFNSTICLKFWPAKSRYIVDKFTQGSILFHRDHLEDVLDAIDTVINPHVYQHSGIMAQFEIAHAICSRGIVISYSDIEGVHVISES